MPEKKNKEEKEPEKTSIVEEFFKAIKLGGLIKALKKSDAFKERLRETDERIKENLEKGTTSETPLQTKAGLSIRPITRRGIQTTKRLKTQRVRVKEKEYLVEVFDEKKRLRVIAELPEVKEKEIKTRFTGKSLSITVKDYSTKVNLPCEIEKIVGRVFKNNVLEIVLKKKV